MRIKEMIANLSSFDCETNSTNSYQRKCKANSVENMNADVRVQEVNEVFRTFMNSVTIIHRSWTKSNFIYYSLFRKELRKFFLLILFSWRRHQPQCLKRTEWRYFCTSINLWRLYIWSRNILYFKFYWGSKEIKIKIISF